MDNNRGVSIASFLGLIFYPLWGHKWKSLRVTLLQFSKKLRNTILKSYKNFHGRGQRHFSATPIWTTVQIHMTHPVYFSAYLTRSIPRSLGTESYCGQLRRFQTASFPIATPHSLTPISAPHSHAGLLKTTSTVLSTWGISMYVHYQTKRNTVYICISRIGLVKIKK